MAKKKVKKSKAKSSSRKTKRTISKTKKIVASKRKVSLALKNLILFTILSVLSFGLTYVFSDEILVSFFWMTSLISGFVAVAFLISYLVLFFMKLLKK
jgi:uncharacterized membrane protein|tara:strand:- start:7113 stop:7406 length:294 start_codon:yes stop_codon:yes gene_type:complete